MQENLVNGHYESEKEEEITPRDYYVWANSFARYCQHLVQECGGQITRESMEKLERALLDGKLILNSLGKQVQHPNKTMIPASGLNRFNQPKELLGSKELANKVQHYPFKAELGTSTNLKTIPLPSRTYLKKKTPPTQ